jgi:hypothetical protein
MGGATDETLPPHFINLVVPGTPALAPARVVA